MASADRYVVCCACRSGGTNIYGALHHRPSLSDIAAWQWPGLNETEALHYFKKSENHPLGGPFHGDAGRASPQSHFINSLRTLTMSHPGPIPIHVDNDEDVHVGQDLLIQAAANLGFPTPEDTENGYNT
jgi:hypothetical protein